MLKSKKIVSLVLAFVMFAALINGVVPFGFKTVEAATSAGVITGLSVKDTENAADWWAMTNIQVGDTLFGDRTYKIQSLPSTYLGSDWIRTANDSKEYFGDSVVTFTVTKDCSVYVAHDDRITPKPSWLIEWVDTGDNLFDDEETNVSYSLYKKDFAANSLVSLGSNGSTKCMYTTIVKAAGGTPGTNLYGDLNKDNKVNSTDYALLRRYILGIVDFDSDQLRYGDLNLDNKVNSTDYAILRRYILGIITSVPLGDVTPTPTSTTPPKPTPTSTPTAGDSALDPFASSPVGFASINGGTTGGKGGQTVTVTNQADLERYAGSSLPYTIRVQGTIKISPFGKEVKVTSNKTIIGVGSDATISQGGFNLSYVKNVIIRNLTIRDTYVEGDHEGKTQDYDAIQVDTSSNIWIDHCLLTRCGDGLLDLRKDTTYVTVSWCILRNHNKAFGIGWTDKSEHELTIHHTWFDNTHQRNPSFDNGTGHLFNNYLSGITSYGNYSRGRAKLVIENSYFKNTINPYMVDPGAELVSKGNIVDDCSGRKEIKGSAFDPSRYYSYKLDKAEDVPNLIKKYAGPNSNVK